MNPIPIEYLKEWVGREQQTKDPLNPFPARALAAALDHTKILGFGDPLPPSWHWLYFLDAPSSSGTAADGHAQKGNFLPPVPLARRMWAAGSLEIERPLRLGMTAERISTIRSVELKPGKTGELVFVTIQHKMFQEGELCIAEEQTLVYRETPSGAVAPAAGETAPAAASWSKHFQPDPVLLFRFSALTYNSHRIHYDRDYATRQEFYSGLVVHAPLLVTLLLDLALRENPQGLISKFQFRAVRPTFDFELVRLCGRIEGQVITLWSAGQSDYLGVKATALLGNRL